MFAYNLSRDKMADKLGVTTQSIGRWISESRLPPRSTRLAVSLILGIPEDILTNHDLTLEIIYKSGILENKGDFKYEIAGVAESEGMYGKNKLDAVVKKHLQKINEALAEVISGNESLVAQIKDSNF